MRNFFYSLYLDIDCQLSIDNQQLSIVNQQSTINNQQSSILIIFAITFFSNLDKGHI